MTGVALLGLFLAFGFSGYLLPWNQLAFFATRVGTAIVGAVPVVGKYLLLLARGGEDITGDTLARFYALHVVILPLAALALIGLHLFLVQKHGMSVPESAARRYGGAENACRSMPFVPHFLLRDMVGWYVALGAAGGLGRAVSLGTRAKGRSLRLGPGGNQAGMVFPLHVPDAEETSRRISSTSSGWKAKWWACCSSVFAGWWCCWCRFWTSGLRAAARGGSEFLGRAGGGVFHRHDRLGIVGPNERLIRALMLAPAASARCREVRMHWRHVGRCAAARAVAPACAMAAETPAANHWPRRPQRPPRPPPAEQLPASCHGNADVWEGETRYLVT